MEETSSLVDLCCGKLASMLNAADCTLHEHIGDLPLELFNSILVRLTPLALHYLQRTCLRVHQQCAEFEACFAAAWRRLLERDHGEIVSKHSGHGSWEQLYWEAHIQRCLDKLVNEVSIPFFTRQVQTIALPDELVETIGGPCFYGSHQCTTLGNTFPLVAEYVKNLRLRNVLLSRETLKLFNTAALESISFWNVKPNPRFYVVLHLIQANHLQRLEFIHSSFLEEEFRHLLSVLHLSKTLRHVTISCSLISMTGSCAQLQQSLSTLTSCSFVSNNLPLELLSCFFVDLLSQPLVTHVDFTENMLGSCFTFPKVGQYFASCSTHQSQRRPMKLQVLNLKTCHLYSICLQKMASYLSLLTNLQSLDLSNNPIGDSGVQALVACLHPSLKELYLSGCEMTLNGASFLLNTLVFSNHDLHRLSIADNSLGRESPAVLARFIEKSNVRCLNISEIGLGSDGCTPELTVALKSNRKLVELNISRNRLSHAGANLLHDVITQGEGSLKVIEARYNLFKMEAMKLFVEAVRLKGGEIELLDLRGNFGDYCELRNLFSQYVEDGPKVLLSSMAVLPFHDDDP